MFRFVHTSDWQLGARFSQFGSRGTALREARLQTLRRSLDVARQNAVDAYFVAGDLFEDNQIADSLVVAVLQLFVEFPVIPIYILPGNHDPLTGPDSIWQRKPLLNPPAHVHVLREAGATELGGNVYLVSAPLHQKKSTADPSLRLVELAAALPADAIKIGLTHGSLAIESKHQPDDFPIALNAASRAGLDYLGLGHWHNWWADTDMGRMVMPGTPEPDNFGNDDSGNLALVEIAAHGQPPNVKKVRVSTLAWRTHTFDFLSLDSSRATLTALLAEFAPKAAATVLRILLTGTASPSDSAAARSWLEPAIAPFIACQLLDQTRIALSSAELAELQGSHPILAQVLADIDRLEAMATGTIAVTPALQPTDLTPLARTEAETLLENSKIKLSELTPAQFVQMRQTLFRSLQEVIR